MAGIFALIFLLRKRNRSLSIWEKIGIAIGIIVGILVWLTFLFGIQYELPLSIRIIVSIIGALIIVVVVLFHYRIPSRIKQKIKEKVSSKSGTNVTKQLQQREETHEVSLHYNRLVVKQDVFSYGGIIGSHPVYYLRIIKKNGKGRAENCNGFITLGRNEINNNSLWDGDTPYVPITHQADLKLFKVHENQYTREKTIIFYYGHDEKKLLQYHVQYNEQNLDKHVTVKLGSSNAKVPTPYVKTIRGIIQGATP